MSLQLPWIFAQLFEDLRTKVEDHGLSTANAVKVFFQEVKTLGKLKKIRKMQGTVPHVFYYFEGATLEVRGQTAQVTSAFLKFGCLSTTCGHCIFLGVRCIEQEIARQRWRKRRELVMGLAALNLPVLVLCEIWKHYRKTRIVDAEDISWEEIAYTRNKRFS